MHGGRLKKLGICLYGSLNRPLDLSIYISTISIGYFISLSLSLSLYVSYKHMHIHVCMYHFSIKPLFL